MADAEKKPGEVPLEVESEQDIEKVKELLFGREQRSTHERIAALEHQLDEAAKETHKKIAELEKAQAKASDDHTRDLEGRIAKIGDAITELGKTISNIANSG